MRPRVVVACLACSALACPLACELALPIHESGDAAFDATLDVDNDAGSDAPLDVTTSDRIQDNTTVFCGPDLACSRSDLSKGCCVLVNQDSGVPPTNYQYECVDSKTCGVDQGSDAGGVEITCDDGTDCPNPADICCWPNNNQPHITYCFAPTATNCTYELCNPNAATPCINNPKHLGWKCVPSGSVTPQLAPLGYHICVPADGG